MFETVTVGFCHSILIGSYWGSTDRKRSNLPNQTKTVSIETKIYIYRGRQEKDRCVFLKPMLSETSRGEEFLGFQQGKNFLNLCYQ
jgi:hypothetical protein